MRSENTKFQLLIDGFVSLHFPGKITERKSQREHSRKSARLYNIQAAT